MEGLRARGQAAEDDTARNGVPARFFLHVLPRGFVRIRHFGSLANHHRGVLLPLCRRLLAMLPGSPPIKIADGSSVWHCPRCGAGMVVVQRFSTAELSRCGYFDSS